jgi:hypothetical protein
VRIKGRHSQRRAPWASLAALLCLAALAGCSERDIATLALAPGNSDPVVFDDAFGAGVTFQAFAGSKYDAVSVDNTEARVGSASLRVIVPGPNDADGTYAGGAFTSSDYRDLSSYNALVFYAKSSIPSTLNEVGFGIDNTGTSRYDVHRFAIDLTTDWLLVVVPIPNPARLTLERGLFFFAEAYENNQGFTLWFDEVRFTQVGTITSPRPKMDDQSIETFPGATVTPANTRVTFSVNGEDVELTNSPRYFDYFSSDESVAETAGGVITAVGGGAATITAKLDSVDVEGTIELSVLTPPAEPAPTPTYPAEDVIALFSDAYTPVPVDTWRTDWSQSGPVEDYEIEGNDTKLYTDLVYAGIEFSSSLIDATDMTYFRLDVWAPEGTIFRVKLVDFGEDGVYNLPIDESELTFYANSTPAFRPGQWSVLDIPLSDFTLESRAHLAQLIISSSDARIVFIDNVLFHR